jgi:hypothetical protein
LQIVDLLTSAVTFEFRQNAGLAGKTSPKAKLAKKLRERYGVVSFLGGCDLPNINVALYAENISAPSATTT